MKGKILTEYFETLQIKQIVRKFYARGDIDLLIRTLDTFDQCIKPESIKNSEIEKCEKYIRIVACLNLKFSIINDVLCTEELEHRQEDFIKLGQYIQRLGKQIENFEEYKKNFDNDCSDNVSNGTFNLNN